MSDGDVTLNCLGDWQQSTIKTNIETIDREKIGTIYYYSLGFKGACLYNFRTAKADL